ncbi:MAG TPA: hypothetical protein VFP84_11930 [Kofleriaceae bacterium]|nr:hypothetical protein [Kofleriaceae bacterium]
MSDPLLDLETPCYVFDPQVVLAQYAALRGQLATKLIVSLKANAHPDLFVRCGHAFADGVELASIGELDVVVGRGTLPKYLNNPAMTDELMRAGLASRCHFVLDNEDSARRFAALAKGHTIASVTLRMNAAALAGSAARKEWHDHFGMTPHEAFAVAGQLAAAGIRVTGLHVFAGSHSFRAESADLALALGRFAEELAGPAGGALTFLNLGGGFSEKGHDAAAFAHHRERTAPLAARFELAHESGRAIFGAAGVFVTRVVAVKPWRDQVIAVCDGGMSHNFLLARTETVMKTWQAPRLVRVSDSPSAASAGAQTTTFVGSTCSRADVIGKLVGAPPPAVGDRVVFEHCGAYNRTYTVSGFLSHKPAHVFIRQA